MSKFFLIFFILFSSQLYGQEKKLSLVLGSNISNPHRFLEGIRSYYDIPTINAFGSIYLGAIYKQKLQVNLTTELNEFNGLNYIDTDLILSGRYYSSKKNKLLKPYIELGTVISSFGIINNDIKSIRAICSEIGFLYKLNKIVNFSFSFNYQLREMNIATKYVDFTDYVITDRIMVKTGIQFKY